MIIISGCGSVRVILFIMHTTHTDTQTHTRHKYTYECIGLCLLEGMCDCILVRKSVRACMLMRVFEY